MPCSARAGRKKTPRASWSFAAIFWIQYTGDFLPSLSGRRWVLPKASALSQKYLSVVLRACDLLLAGGERSSAQEVLDICSRALLLEPLS